MALLRRRSEEPGGPAMEPLEKRLDRESPSSELLDVPAAVVCALCGDVDCAGCENEQSRSGIVAIVAWERAQAPALARLWSTARSTTRDAEGFFELLPDGPIMPALRFAALCEVLAASVWMLAMMLVAVVVRPDWVAHVALDPHARAIALRVLILGVPAFAGLLLLLHSTHGLSIDVGATRNGARSARSRALRFGLYACGWDLVMSPIGMVVVSIKESVGAGLGVLGAGNGLPTKATRAFLRGCYRLDGERAKSALGTSYVGAVTATGIGVVVVLGAILAAIFA
jgi:hypothetical protein